MNLRYRSLLAGFFTLLLALLVATFAPAAETVHLTQDQELVVRVAHVVPLPTWVKGADQDLVRGAVTLLRQNKLDLFEKDWRSMVQAWATGDRHSDEIDVLGTWILREGLLVPHADLNDAARQLGETHELLKVQRASVSSVANALQKLPSAGGATTAVHVKGIRNGKPFDDGVRQMSSAQIASLKGSLETELNRLSDMQQKQQLDLQKIMNKQQQAMQTLSNMSKMIHDTLKAIIQNMK